MKPRVVLKRIYHHEAWWLAALFAYDGKLNSAVASLEGARFSKTHKCYLISDNEENLRLLLDVLKDKAEVDIALLTKWELGVDSQPYSDSKPDPSGFSGVMKKDESGVHPKTTIELSDKEEGTSFSKSDSFFRKPGPVEFRISEKEGLLVIKFTGKYKSEWIDEMKTYGRCYYDRQRKEWLLRWSRLTCDSLADYFNSKGVQVNIIKQVVDPELTASRKLTGEEIRGRELNSKASEGLELLAGFLDENRYSPRTREAYLSMLELFFRYFSHKDPDEITEDEISRFIYDFIIRLGYSSAYQNQMVSAIKTFYTISGKGKVDPDFFERPRRRRSLPKVFSKEEVSRILNSGHNLKHKLLLWIIYSCGLRRSEVINIRLSDLDRDRGVLFIRQGKGGVDRIVPMSLKVWDKIDEYMAAYTPKLYLFEGQTGGRYSVESVYRVFKEALLRSGIRKEVGVHCLRHSYATHLHESGLDIRYIQELLGHKSTRTTEIYTHVSRRDLIQVRSPIEDLDVR